MAEPGELLAPGELLDAIGRAERDVVHRSRAGATRPAAGDLDEIEELAHLAGGGEAKAVAGFADLAIAEGLGEQARGLGGVVQGRGHAMESAQRLWRRHGAAGPGLDRPGVRDRDQFDCHAVRIQEAQHLFAEARRGAFHAHAVPRQTLEPVVKRFRGDRVGGGRHFSRAPGAAVGVGPREESEDRPGGADRIAEVEVVAAGIVEVDRALHEPQPKHPGVEIEIALRLAGDRGDVMEAGDVHGGGGCGSRWFRISVSRWHGPWTACRRRG